MAIFTSLYDRCMSWARHRHAPWYLTALSFAESSFFPIPPDVMLAPMSMADPGRAMRLATITTLASVFGGLFGYLIGYFAFEAVEPWIRSAGYGESYQRAHAWFEQWGFLAMLIAGFSPIPYKVFTIAAGSLAMNPMPFVVASLIGRGGRFFLVAGLMAWGGPRMETMLRTYVERIGWAVVAAGVGAYILLRG
jgi:membrane protein YqaA with SNARE-associated domain